MLCSRKIWKYFDFLFDFEKIEGIYDPNVLPAAPML